MKKQTLVKSILLTLAVSQALMETGHAFERSKEVVLAKNLEAISDPYYQVESVISRELTEEEALEFAGDDVSLKNNTIPTFPNLPTRPANPIAPQAPTNPSLTDGKSGTAGPVKPSGFFEGVIMVVDKLIAIGQKIIPTIEKGKAVVTNNPMSAVSVLPRVEGQDYVVHDMGGWSTPATKHFQVEYYNGLGMKIVDFVYSVTYQHSGKYNGKGHYLTGIRVSARKINVVWGFDVDASSQLIQISNVGTVNNVIAGATIEMAYTVKNWTRQVTNYKSYFITGAGKLIALD